MGLGCEEAGRDPVEVVARALAIEVALAVRLNIRDVLLRREHGLRQKREPGMMEVSETSQIPFCNRAPTAAACTLLRNRNHKPSDVSHTRQLALLAKPLQLQSTRQEARKGRHGTFSELDFDFSQLLIFLGPRKGA